MAIQPRSEFDDTSNFLQKLGSNKDLTPKSLADIAQKALGQNPTIPQLHDLVKSSISTLKDRVDVNKVKSSAAFETEMKGAIKAYSILLDRSTKPATKVLISKDLEEAKQLYIQWNRAMLLNAAIAKHPEYMEMRTGQFLKQFGALCYLYGDTRKLDPEIVIWLMKVCSDPDGAKIYDDFQRAMYKARKTNLGLLESHQLPTKDMPHNLSAIDINDKRNKFLSEELYSKYDFFNQDDYVKLNTIFWDIANRSVVLNTQVHTDSLSLAFNCEATEDGALSRYRENLKLAVDGYISKHNCNFLEKSLWVPPIAATEPLKAIERVISFQTKEGQISEGRAKLDLSFIGNPTVAPNAKITILAEKTKLAKNAEPDTLELAKIDLENFLANELAEIIKEKTQLTEIIRLCDKEISTNPSSLEKLLSGDTTQYSKEISDQLAKMEWLSVDGKKLLVIEAARFAFEVNYQITEKLLKLA